VRRPTRRHRVPDPRSEGPICKARKGSGTSAETAEPPDGHGGRNKRGGVPHVYGIAPEDMKGKFDVRHVKFTVLQLRFTEDRQVVAKSAARK